MNIQSHIHLSLIACLDSFSGMGMSVINFHPHVLTFIRFSWHQQDFWLHFPFPEFILILSSTNEPSTCSLQSYKHGMKMSEKITNYAKPPYAASRPHNFFIVFWQERILGRESLHMRLAMTEVGWWIWVMSGWTVPDTRLCWASHPKEKKYRAAPSQETIKKRKVDSAFRISTTYAM